MSSHYLVQPSVSASGLEMGTWATKSLYDSSTLPRCLSLSVPIYNMKWGGWMVSEGCFHILAALRKRDYTISPSLHDRRKSEFPSDGRQPPIGTQIWVWPKEGVSPPV